VTPQSGNRVSTSLSNSGLCWTVFARNRDTAVLAEGNGDLQTLICVLVARPRWCLTLLNPVPWQNWMAAISATLCGWRRCFVADQLWLMTRIREEEEEKVVEKLPNTSAHRLSSINFQIHSVSLTSLVSIHLLIHLSTHLHHHPHSRHPSLLRSFTPGSKPTFSTNPSHLRLLLPTGLPSW